MVLNFEAPAHTFHPRAQNGDHFFGILSAISSDILSDILSGLLSGISSDILSGIFSSR